MGTEIDVFKMRFNPFEPSASGAPANRQIWLPKSWTDKMQAILSTAERGQGPKALAIRGEYGAGKTYLLKWLETTELPDRRIQAYYFDNPGVQFYDLANSLLRQIGRLNFAKLLWELLNPEVSIRQKGFFDHDLFYWLGSAKGKSERNRLINELQRAIQKKEISGDEEIAHKLARLVIETKEKPFYEYRDFVVGHKDALVAEGEEAPYFNAILRGH